MSNEPDFVNEQGVKWFKNPLLTNYARSPDSHGIVLDADGWMVEEPSGVRTLLLISPKGEFLAESQQLETIGAKIDLLKLVQREGVSP